MFRKIRSKILLPTLTIFFIALAVTGSVSAYLTYNSTLKTLNQTMTETIAVASAQITAEIGNYRTLLTELAGTVDYINSEQVMGFLENARERHDFENMSITNAEGTVGGTSDSVAQYDFYKVPRDQHTPYVSEPVANADGTAMTIYISAPIMVEGRFGGIIFTGVDAKFLSDIVARISVGETGTAAIIDKNGATIAYQDYDTVLSAYSTQVEEKSDPKLARLAALEREAMAGNTGFGAYSYGGANKFMAYAPVEGSNQWGMYVTVEQNEFLKGTYTSIFLSVTIIFIFLILAGIVLVALANSISRPISTVERASREMAKGDFNVTIDYTSRDEIGTLAESMRQMMSSTKEIIEDTARGLHEVANGNFDIKPQVPYIGVFKGIETSMFKIITDLSDTMSQIKISAEQVSSGSEQVSSGAQALAQGATEQASSVQELAATISEVSEQIRKNAENSTAVNALATSAGEKLNSSSQQMEHMMNAMSEISSSSAQIGKIIKTIEDIAFQTNILALNAAVEAARAGAAGKGFAVVADEVRNLATKSSEAAKQTNALIEGSLKSVQNGVKIANETAQSLTEVVSGSLEMASVITQIAQATAEQANSITQINLGVEQISSVVQTNSATSEQSAAASDELNAQAGKMKQLVSRFRVSDASEAEARHTITENAADRAVLQSPSEKY